MSGHSFMPLYMAGSYTPTFVSVGSIGTVQSSTANQTDLTLTTTAEIFSGNLLVLIIAVDNNGTTDGTWDEISGVLDMLGNTWVRAGEYTYGQGAAQAGATCSVWYTQAAIGFAAGINIVASFANSASCDKSCATAWQFQLHNGTTLAVAASNTLTESRDPSSLDATTTNLQCLRVRGIASETDSTTALTPTSGWTAFGGDQTAGGAADTNMAVRGEFKISSGTGDASDPTFVSADHASVYIAFKYT